MTRTPWTILVSAFVVSSLGFLLRQGLGTSQLLAATIAAAALCVGSAFAPISYSTTKLDPAEIVRRRTIQFAVATLAALLAAWIVVHNVGTAAIVGIVAALVSGAAMTRQNAVRER